MLLNESLQLTFHLKHCLLLLLLLLIGDVIMRIQSSNVVKLPIYLSRSLSEVQDWLKTVPTLSLEPVKCGNSSLDEPVVEAIEQAIQKTKVNIKRNILILYLIFVLRRQPMPPY